MLSDVSSVVSDYVFSEKPFAVTDMLDKGPDFPTVFPMARGAYVIRRDMSNADEIFANMFGPDPLEDRRRDMRTYYLGDFPTEGYAEGFLTAARRVVSAAHRTPVMVPEND